MRCRCAAIPTSPRPSPPLRGREGGTAKQAMNNPLYYGDNLDVLSPQSSAVIEVILQELGNSRSEACPLPLSFGESSALGERGDA